MNAPLPIVHSILDADALGAEIQAHFGLPGPVRCELFTRGMNDVYLVRAAGRSSRRTCPPLLAVKAFRHKMA